MGSHYIAIEKGHLNMEPFDVLKRVAAAGLFDALRLDAKPLKIKIRSPLRSWGAPPPGTTLQSPCFERAVSPVSIVVSDG